MKTLIPITWILACAGVAQGQTLEWTIEKQGDLAATAQAWKRPAALKPHLDFPFSNQACEVYSEIALNYNVIMTNLTNAPLNVHPNGNALSPFVMWGGGQAPGTGCGLCWLTSDPSGQFLFQGEDVTLMPNETRVVSGSADWPLSNAGWSPVYTCGGPALSACSSDGLHGAGNVAFVPNAATTWNLYGGASYSVSEISSALHADVRVRTRYALPSVGANNGCNPLNANSTGASGELAAFGVADIQEGLVVLSASSLPVGEWGYFLIGTQAGLGTPLGSGLGTLCLGGTIYRWHESLARVPATGVVNQAIDPQSVPVPGGLSAGSAWHFQLWHRDFVGGQSSSNTTNGVEVTYQ